MMIWKMIFLFQWSIHRFQPLIFRGVPSKITHDNHMPSLATSGVPNINDGISTHRTARLARLTWRCCRCCIGHEDIATKKMYLSPWTSPMDIGFTCEYHRSSLHWKGFRTVNLLVATNQLIPTMWFRQVILSTFSCFQTNWKGFRC